MHILCASLGHVTQCFAALIGHILPVASLHLVRGEELRAHTHTEDTGLEPLLERHRQSP